jgi:peptidoglycan/xylan/chitin deacetylase (PgdA/CDA1 family)
VSSFPLVLCYHGVSAEWTSGLAVAPEAVERQLSALVGRGYRGIAAEEVATRRGRLLHVTFDDAYTSIQGALPALERLGVPSTVFVCTGLADQGLPVDVPELAAERRAFPDELVTLDWDGLRGLAERGVEIGSHSRTHAHLTQLSDRELASELQDSRAAIEEALRRPCRYLAYPFGEQDARVRRHAETAGYEAAFALPGRLVPLHRYALPRIGVYRRDTLTRVRLKASRPGRVLAALGE